METSCTSRVPWRVMFLDLETGKLVGKPSASNTDYSQGAEPQ
jgi:hypothetical protein